MVCLTGGETARPIYERWSDPAGPWVARIDWSGLQFFWSDERHVPPEHPDSNFGMAMRTLLGRVPVDGSQIHRVRGELPEAVDAAAEYRVELQRAFTLAGRQSVIFDVVLLSVGEDGHIASIFPDGPVLETRESVAAARAPHLGAWRITLTPAVLLDAAALFVIASGRRKAGAVHAALEGPLDPRRCPAQLLRTAGERVEWIVDGDAASTLSGRPPTSRSA